MSEDVGTLGAMIRGADRILIVTGAGISTETGIPDFRGPKGVWKTQRPVEFQDFLASERSRIEYWNQKLLAGKTISAARPGRVHAACVRLEQAGKLEAIVTQNIDGLHAEAGSSPEIVVEVHGTARVAGCLDCGERSPVEPHFEEFARTNRPPRCHCGGLVKPATISFGQALDAVTMSNAQRAAESCDLVVALGTTLSVYPAADIPLHAARRGVPYAIVNRGATDHDASPLVTLRIDADVGQVLESAVSVALAR